MVQLPFVERARVLRALACVLLMLPATTCTDGGVPLSPESGGSAASRLGFRPQFNVFGASVNSAPINLVHLVARDSASGTVLADTIITVVPDDAAWNLGLVLRVPPGVTEPRVIVTIELVNETAGVRSVEWSGVTQPIDVRPGSTANSQPVPLFQGPPGNLSITSVVVSPETSTIVEGDTVVMSAAVTGATGAPRVFWSVSDPLVAIVSEAGVVRGLRDGQVRVIGVAGPRADTAVITIRQRAASVVIAPDSVVASSLGEVVSFTARVLDPRGNEVAGAGVVWESRSPAVAGSLGAGQFQLHSNGRTFAVATAVANSALRDSAVVRLTQVPVLARMEPAELTLSALGQKGSLSLLVTDARGNPVDVTPSWSSDDPAIVTVDGAGVVTAVRGGSTTVRAVLAGGLGGSATVHVVPQPQRIEVSPGDVRFTSTGDSTALSARALDALGTEVPGVAITWTSEQPNIATVSATGVVRAVAAGTTRVRAVGAGVDGFATIVVAPTVASLAISPDSLELRSLGASAQLTVSAADRAGRAFTPVVTWSTGDAAIATVAADGLVTAQANGSAWVFAAADGVRDSARVVVRQRAASLRVTTPLDTLLVGDTVRLAVVARDERGGEVAGAQVAWSSAASATASVSTTGLVTAVAPGSVQLQAALDGAIGSVTIVVLSAGAARLEAAPDTLRFESLRDTARVSVTARNARGVALATPALEWRSLQPLIASVSDGRVTAMQAGTTQIVVSSGSVADTVIAIVAPVARALQVQPRNASILVGDTVRLSATAFDARGNGLADLDVSWASLAPAVAQVDNAGLVTGVGNGTAQLVATLGALSDTVMVTVTTLTADLQLRSLLVTPSATPASDGDTVRVRIVVANTGQVPALAVLGVRLFDAGTGTPGPGSRDTLGIIQPGDSVVLADAVPVDSLGPLPDSVRVGALVDPDNTLAESDESNNGAQSPVFKVRYRVAALQIGPDSVGFGQPADTFRVTPFVGDRFGRPLPGRQITWLSRNPAVASVDSLGTIRPVATGTTWVVASVDAGIDSIRVTARLLAELHWTHIGLPGGQLNEGVAAPVSFTIRNSGVIASVLTQVRLRVTDAVADTVVRDTLFPLPPLAPNDSIVFPGPLVLDSLVAWPDSVRFHLMIDPASIVAEHDEVNNTFTGGSAVHVRLRVFCVVSADSVVLDEPGDTARLPLNVFDRFNRPLTGRSTIWFSLGPGTAAVDSTGLVQRVTGGNTSIVVNVEGVADTIPVRAAPRANLGWSVLTGPGSPIVEGTSFGMGLTVQNRGLVASTATTLRIRLTDPVADTVVVARTVPVPAIPAGDSVMVADTFPLDTLRLWPDSLGYNLAIDPDDTVPESDELDNGYVRGAAFRFWYRVVRVVSADSVSLPNVGDTITLPLVYYDRLNRALAERPVTWTSLNPAVASVDSTGKVTITGSGATSVIVSVAAVSDTVPVRGALPAGFTKIWTGANGSAWTDPGNWSPAVLPATHDTLLIDAAVMPVLTFADTVAGIVIGAGRTMSLEHNLFVRRRAQIDGAISGGGSLILADSTTFRAGAVGRVVVRGHVLVSGPTTINGPLDIDGGTFNVSAHNVTVHGNLTTNGGRLVMQNSAGQLLVRNATFHSNDTFGFLTAGRLQVRGNFASHSNYTTFTPSGSHTVAFEGDSAKTVYFAYGGVNSDRSHFQNVELNGTGAVTLNSLMPVSGDVVIAAGAGEINGQTQQATLMGDLIDPGDNWRFGTTTFTRDDHDVPHMLTTNLVLAAGWNLPGNVVINGNVTIAGDTLNLNGHSLTVHGTLTANGGRVGMRNASDLLVVGREAIFHSNDTYGLLTDGRLEVRGNFASHSNYTTFTPTGNHTVAFEGDSAKTIYFAYGGVNNDRSHFRHVELNGAGTVTLNSFMPVAGNVTIAASAGTIAGATSQATLVGDLVDPGDKWRFGTTTFTRDDHNVPHVLTTDLVLAAGWNLPGNVVINGNVTITGDTLNLNGHSLTVHGTLTANGGRLGMRNAADLLVVGRDVVFHSNDTHGLLTDGRMEVRRNFASHSNYTTFSPSGSHTVAFAGDTAKSIYIAYPGTGSDRSHFQHLELNGAGTVTLNSLLPVAGNVTIAAEAGTINGQTQQARLMGDLIDPGDKWRFQTTTFTRDNHQVPHVLTTNLVLEAGWNLPGNVVINGNVTVAGDTLNLSGRSMTIHGTLTTNGGRLGMRDANDLLVIGRDAIFHSNDTHGLLSDGRMVVRGSFASHSNYTTFTPSGSHTVAFEGDTARTIYFAYGGDNADRSRFQNLELNGAGQVTLSSMLPIAGNLSIAAGAGLVSGGGHAARLAGGFNDPGDHWRIVTTYFTRDDHLAVSAITTNLVLERGWNLTNNVVVNGNITVAGDTLNLNGHSLTIHGELTVNGGRLGMRNAADVLVVGRDAAFHSNDTQNLLTAGRMVLRRNFASHNNYTTFTASGSHTVALEGDTAKTVYFAYGGENMDRSHFHNLEQNGAGAVTLTSMLPVSGALSIAAGAGTISGGGHAARLVGSFSDPGDHWRVATTYLTRDDQVAATAITTNLVLERGWNLSNDVVVNGNITLNSDTLNLNGNALTLHGSFTANGGLLGMRQAGDSLVVGGDATFHTNSTAGLLTAGRLVVRGDFASHSNYTTFTATGSHTVELSGDTAKSVYFAYGGPANDRSNFQNLELAGAGTVNLSSAIHVKGTLAATGATLNGASHAISAAGAAVNGLTITNAPLHLNGGAIAQFDNVTFSGFSTAATQLTVTQTSGTVTMNNLAFSVEPTSGYYIRLNGGPFTLHAPGIAAANLGSHVLLNGNSITQ